MTKKSEKQKAIDKVKADIKALEELMSRHVQESGRVPRGIEAQMLGLKASLAHLQAEE